MKYSIFYLLFLLVLIGGCEKYNPVNPKNQGNPAYGTGDYDYYDYYDVTPTTCTQNYTIHNNDPYNYNLKWPGGGTTYLAGSGSAFYSLTYAGCATVEVYYATGGFISTLSFCPCTDNSNYTVDL